MRSPETYYQPEKIAGGKNKQPDLLIEQKEISEKIKTIRYKPIYPAAILRKRHRDYSAIHANIYCF